MSLIKRPLRHRRTTSTYRKGLSSVGRASMVIVALGIASAASVIAAVTPDPLCSVVPSAAPKVLLMDAAGGTLDSWGGRSGPGHRTCRWEARAVTGGPARVMTLTVDTYPDPAAAKAAMPADVMQAGTSSGALPRGSDDQLASSDSLIVQARHGAVVAIVDATEGQVSAPPWAQHYWLAATALAGAGTRYLPPPSLPGMMPAGEGVADGAPRWSPPPHDAGSAGRILAPMLSLLKVLADWRFIATGVLIFGAIGIIGVARKRGSPWMHRLAIVIGAYGAINAFLGPTIVDQLIYRFGTTGAATITGSYDTSTRYNNHDVVGYHLLIRTREGQVVPTSFEDDDFNVYPPHNATSYPGEDDQFTVRYLPGFPKRFVIVANDGSPWARGLRCGKLRSADLAIRRRVAFAGGSDATLRRQADMSAKALHENGC